jgi:hypothetical protein
MSDQDRKERHEQLGALLAEELTSEQRARALESVSHDDELSMLYLAATDARARRQEAQGEGQSVAARQHALERVLFSRAPNLLSRPRLAVAVYGGSPWRSPLQRPFAGIALVLPSLLRWQTAPEFRAKGNGTDAAVVSTVSRRPKVVAYRVVGGRYRRLAAVGVGGAAKVRSNDAFAFAYSNRDVEHDRLMIFAVDDKLEVYWFYPAYLTASSDPPAYAAKVGQNIELPRQHPPPIQRQAAQDLCAFLATRNTGGACRLSKGWFSGSNAKNKRLDQLDRFPLLSSSQQSWSLSVAP